MVTPTSANSSVSPTSRSSTSQKLPAKQSITNTLGIATIGRGSYIDTTSPSPLNIRNSTNSSRSTNRESTTSNNDIDNSQNESDDSDLRTPLMKDIQGHRKSSTISQRPSNRGSAVLLNYEIFSTDDDTDQATPNNPLSNNYGNLIVDHRHLLPSSQNELSNQTSNFEPTASTNAVKGTPRNISGPSSIRFSAQHASNNNSESKRVPTADLTTTPSSDVHSRNLTSLREIQLLLMNNALTRAMELGSNLTLKNANFIFPDQKIIQELFISECAQLFAINERNMKTFVGQLGPNSYIDLSYAGLSESFRTTLIETIVSTRTSNDACQLLANFTAFEAEKKSWMNRLKKNTCTKLVERLYPLLREEVNKLVFDAKMKIQQWKDNEKRLVKEAEKHYLDEIKVHNSRIIRNQERAKENNKNTRE